MLSLWRKTVELLRTHPILCVPYLCADLITSCLSQISYLARHRIIAWAMMQHSVSTEGTKGLDTALTTGALISWSVDLGTRFVNAGLYITALVITAALVSMIVRGQKPSMTAASAELRAYPKRILVYGVLYCLLTIALAVLVFQPASHLLTQRFHQSAELITAAMYGEALFTIAVSSWIMTPFAVRLLRPSGASALSAEVKKQARYFALLAGTAVLVISLAFAPLMAKLFSPSGYSGLQWAAAQTLESLLVNLPFVLVYIAFALLACDMPLDSEKPSAPSRLREYLRVLAPMHTHPPDEQ